MISSGTELISTLPGDADFVTKSGIQSIPISLHAKETVRQFPTKFNEFKGPTQLLGVKKIGPAQEITFANSPDQDEGRTQTISLIRSGIRHLHYRSTHYLCLSELPGIFYPLHLNTEFILVLGGQGDLRGKPAPPFCQLSLYTRNRLMPIPSLLPSHGLRWSTRS